MSRTRIKAFGWLSTIVLVVFGASVARGGDIVDQRAVYWFFSLNDESEIQFHASAVSDAPMSGEFLESLPSDTLGTLFLVVEGSTGWFLDTPGATSTAVAAQAGESAAVAAATEPKENEKRRTVDLARIWAYDDDMNDIANWTLHTVELTGYSRGTDYVVIIGYEDADVVSEAN